MYLRVILWEDLNTSIDEMTKTLAELKARFGNVALFSGSAQTDSYNPYGEHLEATGYDGIGVIIPIGNLPEYPVYIDAAKAVEACRRNCREHPENFAYYEAKVIARRLNAKKSLSEAEALLLIGCLDDCKIVEDYHEALGEACAILEDALRALEVALDKLKMSLRDQFPLRDPFSRTAMRDDNLAELGMTEEPKPY